MGSCLLRPDGTPVWLNLRNALGHYNLSLPFTLPLSECRDDLVPGPLLGTEAVMPRLFGFTEYADLLEILESGGFRAAHAGDEHAGPRTTSSATTGGATSWTRRAGCTRRWSRWPRPAATADARFNVIGHSMGGLVARYYLRYGTAEPEEGAPVTWAGARRIQNLILVAVPNGGGRPRAGGPALREPGRACPTRRWPPRSSRACRRPTSCCRPRAPPRSSTTTWSRWTRTCTTSRPGSASAGAPSRRPWCAA